MQTIRPNDKRAWLWLAIGAALLPFAQFQTVLPLAAWLAPIFLLRFARTQRLWIAVLGLALVHYTASVIAMRNILPAPAIYLIGLAGVTGVAAYLADRWLASHLSGLARTLVFPASAVAVDWLFGQGSLGTTGSMAYAHVGNLSLTQLASVVGMWGLVFLPAWLAPVANEAWEQQLDRRTLRFVIAPFAAVLLVAILAGSARLAFSAPSTTTVRVASLAADRALWHGLNVPRLPDLAAADDSVRAQARAQFAPIVDELLDRTQQQANAGAKIVVWSEAAAFALKEDEPALLDRARTLAREQGIYLQASVVFALRADRYPFAENRAILIDPSGQVVWDYYKAVHPLDDASIFAPGPGVVPIVDTPYGRIATVICFDADFPALVQQAGQARADILLVPANDWRPVHIMHARMAELRAIENGTALVRATGNGIAFAVDRLGQPLATADYFATDRLTMVAEVPTRGSATLYARIGDGFAYLCIAGLAALAVWPLARRVAGIKVPRLAHE
jgi:apolipoprotein N-acyltransferase